VLLDFVTDQFDRASNRRVFGSDILDKDTRWRVVSIHQIDRCVGFDLGSIRASDTDSQAEKLLVGLWFRAFRLCVNSEERIIGNV